MVVTSPPTHYTIMFDFSWMFVGVGLVGIVVLMTAASFVVTVPMGHVAIQGHFGKPERTLKSGLHFLGPFDNLIDVKWAYTEGLSNGRTKRIWFARQFVDIRERRLDTVPVNVRSADGAPIILDIVLQIRVTDVMKAVGGHTNLPDLLVDLAQNACIDATQKLDAEVIMGEGRHQISTAVHDILKEATHGWGVSVTRVNVQGTQAGSEMRKATEAQALAVAQATARQAVFEAQAVEKTRQVQVNAEQAIQAAQAEQKVAKIKAETRAAEMLRQVDMDADQDIQVARAKQGVMEIEAETRVAEMLRLADLNARQTVLDAEAKKRVAVIKEEMLAAGLLERAEVMKKVAEIESETRAADLLRNSKAKCGAAELAAAAAAAEWKSMHEAGFDLDQYMEFLRDRDMAKIGLEKGTIMMGYPTVAGGGGGTMSLGAYAPLGPMPVFPAAAAPITSPRVRNRTSRK